MYTNILVPVIFDANYDSNTSFDVARKLAGDGAKFTVVHVLESFPSYATSEIPPSILGHTREEAKKSLLKTAEALSGATAKLLSGHAGSVIVDYADKNGIDCIVMTSHRPGFADLFLGSTASRVVRHAKCSVHVVR